MKQFAMTVLVLTTLVMSGCNSQSRTDTDNEDLVIIGISDETEEAVRKLKKPVANYYMAIDTQRRMKDQLEVTGIPHVIILEPGGYVVWEGFPYLKGYELTHSIVEKS